MAKMATVDHRYHRVYEDNEHSQYGQNKTTGQNQQAELQRVDRNHSPYTLLIPYCTESGCPHRVVMPRSPVGARQRPEGQRGGSGDGAGEHGGRLVVVHVASVAYRQAGWLALIPATGQHPRLAESEHDRRLRLTNTAQAEIRVLPRPQATRRVIRDDRGRPLPLLA